MKMKAVQFDVAKDELGQVENVVVTLSPGDFLTVINSQPSAQVATGAPDPRSRNVTARIPIADAGNVGLEIGVLNLSGNGVIRISSPINEGRRSEIVDGRKALSSTTLKLEYRQACRLMSSGSGAWIFA